MDSTATLTQDTALAIRTVASPAAYSDLANFTGFDNLGGGSGTQIPTTHFKSSAKEFKVGLKDNGTLSTTMDYDDADAGQLACQAAQDDSTLAYFQLTLADGTTPIARFAAYVLKFAISGKPDDVYRVAMDLLISGAVTWSAS